MTTTNDSRRSFLKRSLAMASAGPFVAGAPPPQAEQVDAPLIAYVGTFSSPLRDVLPTQVDLPPGNGRGIHLFQVDRDTGAMTPAGVHEMGTSPSCLALNAAGTRLYSANETDRVGDDKEGTVSAFAVDRADGKLKPLNTVRSGGAGPTYVSVHPSGRFVLVANYFGGSVAVLPILEDGRLGDATDVKTDAGKVGPTKATNAPPGSFAFSGHDRTHAHMIQADPAGRFVLHVDLGLDRIFVWKFDEKKGTLTAERPARRLAAAPGTGPGISTSTPTAGGSTPSRRKARPSCCSTTTPRRVGWPPGRRSPPCRPGFAGSNFCSEILVSSDGRFVYAGNRLHDSIGIFSVGTGRRPDVRRGGMDARELPAQLQLRPHRPVPLLLQPARRQRRRLPGGSQDRRPRLHRPLRPRRQSVEHRLPRPRPPELSRAHCGCSQSFGDSRTLAKNRDAGGGIPDGVNRAVSPPVSIYPAVISRCPCVSEGALDSLI